MQTNYPRSIQANIAEEAISKVSRFFNASMNQIIDELLQNARRSGATEVHVLVTDNEVIVTDNGRGIANPENVLAFGRSNWSPETAAAEDPAGMGIFSLARRKATIRSRPATGDDSLAPGWKVQLCPEHFVGTNSARVIADDNAPRPHGTQTAFGIEDEQDTTRLERRTSKQNALWTVRDAAEHYPVPVFVNGEAVKRTAFLKDCVATRVWNGVRIGVRKAPDRHWERRAINFHGHRIYCPALPCMTETQVSDTPPTAWWIVIDVIESSELELVLPARHEVVQNEYLKELVEQSWETLYQAVQAEAPATLPYEAWSKAQALGIRLDPAAALLPVWTPSKAEEPKWERPGSRFFDKPRLDVERRGDTLLMTANMECCDAQVTARALELSNLRENVFAAEEQYAGYAWYDAIPRIVSVQIEARSAGWIDNMMDTRARREALQSSEPDEISVILTIRDARGRTTTRRLEVDVALRATDATCIEEMEIALRKNHQIDPGTLADLLFDAYFLPVEDDEGESRGTQAARFYRDCKELSTGLTGSWKQARTERLENLAKTYLAPEIRKDETVRFTIRGNRTIDVEVETESAP